jgi:hypothetical protein
MTTCKPFPPQQGLLLPVRCSSSHNDHKTGILDGLADRLNKAIDEVPRATFASMMVLDIGTVFAANAALHAVGATASAEFALAYAISRVIKRFRLPLELACAAPLARAVPALPRVRVVKLMMPDYERPDVMPSVRFSMDTLRQPGQLLKDLTAISLAVVDKYGLAYTVTSRWVGCAIITALYGLLVAGVDVQGFLAGYGMAELGTSAGTFGLAVAMTSAVYPATIAATAYIAHPLGRAVPILGRRV